MNRKIKKLIRERAAETNPRVQEYAEQVIKKIDLAGPAAGAWLEQLESHFDKLKPDGLLSKFTPGDFKQLRAVLFGPV